MADVTTLPVNGEVFIDDRGPDRSLRVSWHSEASVVVLSLWRHEFCIGSFRLRADDLPDLLDLLSGALTASLQVNGHTGAHSRSADGYATGARASAGHRLVAGGPPRPEPPTPGTGR